MSYEIYINVTFRTRVEPGWQFICDIRVLLIFSRKQEGSLVTLLRPFFINAHHYKWVSAAAAIDALRLEQLSLGFKLIISHTKQHLLSLSLALVLFFGH